jgi:hypothetical protein
LQARKRRTLISSDQLSPENETLERRNLKSILKKLSAGSRAGSRAGSSETSATSTPDCEATAAEMRKLMCAPTLEGYVARHSKLSKSVTFNKYTLQSPPSIEQTNTVSVNASIAGSSSSSSSLAERTIAIVAGSHRQDFLSSQSNKLRFRPINNRVVVPSQMLPSLKESQYLSEIISDIRVIIQSKLVSYIYIIY